MPKDNTHAPQWENALAKVKAQGQTAHVAAAIASASADEGYRWFQTTDKFLFVDPRTYKISEVTQGQLPAGVVLVDLSEAIKQDAALVATPTPKESEAPAPEMVTEAAAEVVAEEMTTSDAPVLQQDGTQDVADPKKKKKKAASDTEPDPNDPNEKQEKAAGKESVRTLYLSELTPLAESVIDAEHKTVDVTLIQSGWSANGKYYSKEVLGRDKGIFEGVKSYADHPGKNEETNRPERSVRDITGYYTNVRQADDGSLKATRHFVGAVGTDVIYPLVVETITNRPDLMGLSINALGKTKLGEVDGRKGIVVEALVKGNSVDDVTTPAAGGKYDRLLMAGDEFTTDLLQALDYEEWRESRPDFVARIKTEMRTARKEELTEAQNQEVVALREQVNALETTRKELEAESQRAQKELTDKLSESQTRVSELVADSKLKESKLPESWTKDLKPQLITKPEAEMDTAIEAERKKYFGVKQPIPVREASGVAITNGQVITEAQAGVAYALGVNPAEAVLEGESPEQYKRRKEQLKRIR